MSACHRDTKDDFINKAQKVHGQQYDYSKVQYVNTNTPVVIICPEHGEFPQQPNNHIQGKVCPVCGGTRKQTTQQFIDKSKIVHDDKYNYSKVMYINNTTPVTIICPTHGEFEQLPKVHRNGHGCPRCGNELPYNKHTYESLQIAVRDSIHGDRYEYDFTPYMEDGNRRINIKCSNHGWFTQTLVNHVVNQSGCPKCANHISNAEMEIYEFVKGFFPEAVQSDRTLIKPLELDIICHELKIAIEYCGIYWHSERAGKKGRQYHLNKVKLVEDAGYRLITIFSNEWMDTPEIVKSRLRYIFGAARTGTAARKLEIQEVDFPTARDFMNTHHTQGSTTQMPVRYGAYDEDQLVAVMAFSKPRINMGRSSGYPELVRFVTDGLNHPGVGSKLFKYFIKQHEPDGVVSYSDRRWSQGNFYQALGFLHDGCSKPSYRYTYDYNKLINRFGYQKSKIVKLFNADPNKSEWTIMQENGYDRIWDCGTDKWVWLARD